MPLSQANFVQHGVTGFLGTSGTVSLPNPSTAGNTIVLTQGSPSAVGTPSGFTKSTGASNTGPAQVYHKLTSGGEQTFTVPGSSTQPVVWDVWELSGLDPDFPVDVTPTTGSVAGGSTGTTPQSTTYDGVAIAVWSGWLSTGTSPAPSWASYTNGFQELSQYSQVGSTSVVTSAVAYLPVQSLGTWSSVATRAGGNGEAATIVVFTAAGAKREPTIAHFWSFPAELIGVTGLNVGSPAYWISQNGSPAIVSGGLQLTGTASIQNISGAAVSTLSTAYRAVVHQVKFSIVSVSGDLELDRIAPISGGGTAVLRYVAASQKLGLTIGTGTEQLSDATVTTGQDYTVDIQLLGNSTSYVANWRINYGSGPVTQAPATFTATGIITSYTPSLGWPVAATGQVLYRHAIYSVMAGHYPLGDYVFPFLKPDTAGTITARTGTTADLRRFTANGTIDASFNSANILAAIRDWPPTLGSAADGAAIITANTGTYSIPMETYDAAANGGNVRTVMVLGAMWAASATAATLQLNGHDGTASTTLMAMADYNADTSSAPPWLAKIWRPTGGWTQAKLDAATLDILSDDATPDVGWHCLGMIACVKLASTQTLFGTLASAAIDPDTGGILKVAVTNPASQGSTLHTEYPSTTDTPVAAGGSQTVVLDAPDAPTTGQVGLFLDPEPEPPS